MTVEPCVPDEVGGDAKRVVRLRWLTENFLAHATRVVRIVLRPFRAIVRIGLVAGAVWSAWSCN